MNALEGIILGLIQGLTEFLPVSSSGHLMIAREILGVELPSDGDFLSFEVIVHAATVLATIVVFRQQIWDLLKGLFAFKYNDQTDYILKIGVSMVPVFVVGMFFKDAVEALFEGLTVVGCALLVTSGLLYFSDVMGKRKNSAKQAKEADGGNQAKADDEVAGTCNPALDSPRGGISYWQAFVVGIAQAVAVIPGLSRSGSTIATGLICGVRRDVMAQFSFLMVLVPILGEAFLDLVKGGFSDSAAAIGIIPLTLGFAAAFISGLFACRVMIALVKKASLKWFALYCAIAGACVLFFAF